MRSPRMHSPWIIVAAATACALAVGCKRRSDPQPPPDPQVATAEASTGGAAQHATVHPAEVAHEDIDWFEGTVEQAFARANADGKPVFLYWGAVWCPPCHQIKATIFSRPDFIEKVKLFVPVYLDGDKPGAQKWGEAFGVTGYPTVVILRGDRTELARVAGGMDLSQYAEVLDLVLGDVRPVKEMLEAVSAGNEQLSYDDCRRLAYNGWGVDDEATADAAGAGHTADALRLAAQRCPADAKVERARLIAIAAYAAAEADAGAIQNQGATHPRLASLIAEVNNVLADQQLAASAGDALLMLRQPFFKAARLVARDNVSQLRKRWVAVMDAMGTDPRFSEADQLIAVRCKLIGVKVLDGDFPREMVREARQRVDESLARKHGEYERAGVVNSVLNLLDLLGDDERAYQVVVAEMQNARTPYYYMLDLAALEEKRGEEDAAIQWLERAYRESRGLATRFQWGTEYVLGLIRMRPGDDALIRNAGLAVLSELDGPDRIYRRTRVRLGKLDTKLRQWNKSGRYAETLSALRKRMDGICARIPEGDAAREACEGFLKA